MVDFHFVLSVTTLGLSTSVWDTWEMNWVLTLANRLRLKVDLTEDPVFQTLYKGKGTNNQCHFLKQIAWGQETRESELLQSRVVARDVVTVSASRIWTPERDKASSQRANSGTSQWGTTLDDILWTTGLACKSRSILLRANCFARIQKVVVDQMGSRPPNNDCDPFLVQVWLWGVLCSFLVVQPLNWLSLVVIQNPFPSHITIRFRNGSFLLHRIREDNTPKWLFFDLWSAHEAPTYWGFSLFQFSPFQTTIERSKLSYWATSQGVVRESASMIALNWSLSTSDGWPLSSSSSRLSSPLQNFLNHHGTVRSLEVPGSNALLML